MSLLVSALLLAAAGAGTRAQEARGGLTAEEVVGSYGYSSQWAGSARTFAAGGKYSQNGGSCTHTSLYEGTYEVAGGRVVIRVNSRRQWPNGNPEAAEEIKPEEGETWDDKPEQLLPVRWGGRLYLMDEDDLRGFCNAVNAGFEPRGGEDDPNYSPLLRGVHFGSFYLREGDEKKKVTGEPELPGGWRRFLLKEPVEGLVLSVGGGEGEAVVNVGARKGLRPGMLLFIVSDGQDLPPEFPDGMQVLSVEEETAKVRGLKRAKVGDKVSTRFELPEE
jgi:hypothetical protein